jgi:hypothetical protein
MHFYQVFYNQGSGKASASRAENADSIPVARSTLKAYLPEGERRVNQPSSFIRRKFCHVAR